jgi:branched-chain amino acid aminotransferase
MCNHWGIKVEERLISIDEVYNAHKDGLLEEVFGTGTAAVISPVGHLRWENHIMQVEDGGIGPLSQKLYNTLTGIQLGKIEDVYNWTVEVE